MLSRFQRYFIMWFVLQIFPVLPLGAAYSFQLCNRFWFGICILVVQFRENVFVLGAFWKEEGKNQSKMLEKLSPVSPQPKARTFQEFHWQRKLCFLGVLWWTLKKSISSVRVRLKTMVWFMEKVPVCDSQESGVFVSKTCFHQYSSNQPIRIVRPEFSLLFLSVANTYVTADTLYQWVPIGRKYLWLYGGSNPGLSLSGFAS